MSFQAYMIFFLLQKKKKNAHTHAQILEDISDVFVHTMKASAIQSYSSSKKDIKVV